jgi:trk system potassium uptake protein TrkH
MPALLPAAGRQTLARIDAAPVLRFLGMVLCCLAGVMLLPAAIDLANGNPEFRVFVAAAAVTLFTGATLTFAFAGGTARIGLRQGVLAVILTWIGTILFGALPFLFAARPLSFTDAIFETTSGLTSTGSTIYVGLDQASRGILLWRFLLAWMGGFGLVTFAVLILPYLRVGGLQLFTIDLSARPGKFLPKTAEVVAQIAFVYVLLTLACAIAFGWAGMSTFDALGHAMAAAATAGFSSHDAGLGHFQSPTIEWIATVFMLLGALPFVLHIHLLRGRPGPLLQESQVRLFLLVIATGVLLLTWWRLQGGAPTFEQAVREAAFNVVAIISTTGFVSHDFHPWGGFASLLLFCAMLMGGCTGSTAGGIKMFRLYVLFQTVRSQVAAQIYPSGSFPARYNGRVIPEAVRAGAVVYFFVYLASVAVLALALCFAGLDFLEGVSAAATALAGAGPALGPRIGPCCTYATLTDPAKWLFALGMLAGRLEILILALPFTRLFWRG